MKSVVGFVVLVGLGSFGAGCSGAQDAATKNRTFYDWTVATGSSGAVDFEQRYPPLDQAVAPPLPEYLGVTVVGGGVHLSRPKNWMLRDGVNTPGQSFVQYISPNAYSFAVYERPESTSELWRDVLQRFEDDTQSLGAKVVGKRIPMATLGSQGRAYTVERQVEAAKAPFVSHSREYILRGKTRIVLVQIVTDSEDLTAVDRELMRVVQTIEVL